MKFYKVLNNDASCFWGGTGKWFLPEGRKPGEWMPAIEGELSPCENGYHVLPVGQLLYWLGPAIFEVQVKGKGISRADKSVYPQARLVRKLEAWNDRTARLFACDCADHVLGIYEKKYPEDKRPRKAIETARLFAEGKATKEELDAALAAARAAALAAAGAAWAAALAAARAAALAAAGAAWDAAGAAWDAAGAAARAAERKWQVGLLKKILGI
jgi:hypothetical protein